MALEEYLPAFSSLSESINLTYSIMLSHVFMWSGKMYF